MAVAKVLALLLTVQLNLGPSPSAEPGLMPTGVASPPQRAGDPGLADARLADVCFVDRQHGWAVGDRGVIWHTRDGGAHWHRQLSAAKCPLRSVCFVNPQIGWAAGGFTDPYAHTSTGELLTTRDGGRTWNHNRGLLLPALRQVGFSDAKNGWAIGCRSAMFPCGAFVTSDGGMSWSPLSGEAASSWLTGGMIDRTTGAAAGRSGTAAMVRRGSLRPARMGSFGLRSLRRMELVAPNLGWLVGDGGLVLTTTDLGSSWQSSPGELPQDVASHFDFAAVAVRGQTCWVAGSPGTRVFRSCDGGRTWNVFSTASRLPLSALEFVDQQHGWAVGALGTILATADGGRTWRQQRSGGSRAALLGLFDEAASVPLELFARLSGNDGYLGVVEVLNRRDVEVRQRGDVHAADRLHEALLGVGASEARTAWRFPLRQAGLHLAASQIVDGWDQVNDAQGVVELERHVTGQIRLWRPEVIVTHDADPRGLDPSGRLINQIVLRAAEKASDPTCFSPQITHAGLEPWQVKKVYAALPPGTRGSQNLTTGQLAVRLGRSLADVAATPRGLIEERYRIAPPTLGFELLTSRLPQELARRDFFSGIPLTPGGDARRQLAEPPVGNLARLQRVVQRQRNMRAIVEQSKAGPLQGSQLLAQTADLTQGLDGNSAGRLLYQLAAQYRDSGRWDMAAETFELLLKEHPDHPLAAPAALWLVQHYASGEASWRTQSKQRHAVQQASTLSIDTSQQEDRPERAAELGKRIERTRPALFASPRLQFPLAVADRNRGFPRQAERFYLSRARGAEQDAWWACAQGEIWLAEPKGLPPKPVRHAALARAKPRLDGKLDDEVWQRAKASELESPQHDDADWPAAVLLAYDREFLYLAVNCRRAPGVQYEPATGPRTRDPDLSQQDRVEVYLDLDRDFVTYYRLCIDHRGHTGEGCWGDCTWDPAWFVAADGDQDAWTAEAAVPLEQLTGQFPSSGTVWALGIQRTVPGVGFQSWASPAAVEVIPEGFGYLIFD